MSRRLPIYLVLDTSGSMSGEPINAVNEGLKTLADALRSEPRAIETAFVSVITFDSKATVAVPLTSAAIFSPPTLTAQGETKLGSGLELLQAQIKSEVFANENLEQKGDWKPLVFVMTDGRPTDEWKGAAADLKRRKLNIIGCAAGEQADEQMLKDLSEIVVKLSDTNTKTMQSFFAWVTQSAKVMSMSVGTASSAGVSVPPPNPNAGIVLIP